jgi:hypothetical protein
VGLTDPAETHARLDLWLEYRERSGQNTWISGWLSLPLSFSPLSGPSSSPLSSKPPDGSNLAHNNQWFFFGFGLSLFYILYFFFGLELMFDG